MVSTKLRVLLLAYRLRGGCFFNSVFAHAILADILPPKPVVYTLCLPFFIHGYKLPASLARIQSWQES